MSLFFRQLAARIIETRRFRRARFAGLDHNPVKV